MVMEEPKLRRESATPFLTSRSWAHAHTTARWIFVTCALFLVFTPHTGIAQTQNPYISYDFFETKKTATDHREILTQIFLSADGYVGFRYREDIYGSIEATVHSLSFSNEYQRKATLAEQRVLITDLLAAKVFDLKSEKKSDAKGYFSSLTVRFEGREVRYAFYSPPESPDRKAIHTIIQEFARRLKVDRPENLASATKVTEGDLQPARNVSLSELLAHPEKYDGKRVSVVGYFHREFEGSFLAVSKIAMEKREYSQSIWRAGPSSFASKSKISTKNDCWQRVEGIFLKGPGGHLGLWPGEIVRLTCVEVVPPPE